MLLPIRILTFCSSRGPFRLCCADTTGWTAADYWFPEIRSVGGAALILSFVLYPYVYLLARASFLEQSLCVLEVSRSLGHGPVIYLSACGTAACPPGHCRGHCPRPDGNPGRLRHRFLFSVYRLSQLAFTAPGFLLGDPVAASKLAACLLMFVLVILSLEALSRPSSPIPSHQQEIPPTGRRSAKPLAGIGGHDSVFNFRYCLASLYH